MSEQCKLSDNTKDYLNKFYDILDEMIIGMTGAELSDSISHNFIVQMIPHHRAAIEMSHNILRFTTYVPLQNIASNIITMQTKSIENMLNAEEVCSEICNTHQDLRLYERRFKQITQNMFKEMESARTTNNINIDFMCEMIPHHRGAVLMSQNALKYSICPELKPILDAIITSQEKGIKEMTSLLQCIG